MLEKEKLNAKVSQNVAKNSKAIKSAKIMLKAKFSSNS